MPAGIKPINCVGKKGRSGRKSASVEFAKKQAIEKAWNKINAELDAESVKDIALPIALKTMTDYKELNVKLPKPILDVLPDNSNNEDKETEQED